MTKPYVLLFTLGRRPGVPKALASAPCYLRRAEHGRVTDAIHKLPEAPTSKADSDSMFAALTEFIETFASDELFSDDELRGDGDRDWTTAFFAGVSVEDARAALVQGGGIVDDYDSLPEAIERQNLVRLERHLDLTSSKLIRESVARRKALPSHADSAAALLTLLVDTILDGVGRRKEEAKAYREALCRTAPTWSDGARDALRLLVERDVKRSPRSSQRGRLAAALLDALREPTSAEARRRPGPRRGRSADRVRPKLFIEKKTRGLLRDGFARSLDEALSTCLDMKDWPRASPPDSAMSRAKAAARALRAVLLSTDTDCPYLPVVLDGPAPATQEFLDATGLGPADLEVVAPRKGGRSIEPFVVSRASDLPDAEREAFAQAATLLGGAVTGVRIRVDDCTRILLALGPAS